MRLALLRTGLLAAAVIGGGVVTAGCTSRTEGERTLEQADRHQQAALTIRRGEVLVEDGKALEDRGEATKRAGDAVAADRLIAEGRAKQAQGRELIEEGRKMKP